MYSQKQLLYKVALSIVGTKRFYFTVYVRVLHVSLNPVPEVSVDNPRVRQAVEEAESRARTAHLEVTSDMYIKALKSGIQEAEQKRREADPTGPL